MLKVGVGIYSAWYSCSGLGTDFTDVGRGPPGPMRNLVLAV